MKHINLGATIDGIVRKDRYELPPENIREAIINTVCHRCYLDHSCVQVAVYDNRVEITSPGILYGGLTMEQAVSGRSKIRNACIAEVFSRMGIVEQWGTGFQRMIQGCKKGGAAMPELPEVETIRRVIEPQIKGLTITNVEVRRPEVVAYPDAEEFCRRLAGQKIGGMARRGKFLGLFFEGGDFVILHLRMTGCLLVEPADFPEEKHTHVVFRLSDGRELRFSDTRRFGRFWLFGKGEMDREHSKDTHSGIGNLGLEPFDKALTAGYLAGRLGKRKRAVKECLLDQGVIAGIGNIYSDEILFAAGIYPACPADRLEREDWERLAAVIPERLSYFIEMNKMTPEKYLERKGQNYRNTPFLQVYGHEGASCPVCGEMFRRMVVGGRGSVYCPVCQKAGDD